MKIVLAVLLLALIPPVNYNEEENIPEPPVIFYQEEEDYKFRKDAFRSVWTRKNIIEFLSCLFDTYIEEAEYKQEDFFEELVA